MLITNKNFDNHFHLNRDPSHSQIESITESTANILDSAVQSVNMLISNVDLKKLTGEQKVQLKDWHQGLQRAALVIRGAD